MLVELGLLPTTWPLEFALHCGAPSEGEVIWGLESWWLCPHHPTPHSQLSITQRFPGTSAARRRKTNRRLFELAKPKTNWRVLKDR